MSLTLKNIKNLQADFDKNHSGRKAFYEEISDENIEVLEHLIVCLIGEVGEFSNIVKKISRGDYQLHQKRSDIEEELTDTFIYLIKISNQLNIDLEDNFLKKLDKNKERFQRYES